MLAAAAFVPPALFHVLFPPGGLGLLVIGTGTQAPALNRNRPSRSAPGMGSPGRPEAREQAVSH